MKKRKRPVPFMAMLKYNIKMTSINDRTSIQINGRTYRTEKHK